MDPRCHAPVKDAFHAQMVKQLIIQQPAPKCFAWSFTPAFATSDFPIILLKTLMINERRARAVPRTVVELSPAAAAPRPTPQILF
jgi:hypothetical protein